MTADSPVVVAVECQRQFLSVYDGGCAPEAVVMASFHQALEEIHCGDASHAL